MPALAHSPADILRRVLIALGHGTSPSASGAWPIHCGTMPDSPDNCVRARGTAGRIEGFSQIDGEASESPGVQVMVRAVDYKTGSAKAWQIANALDEVLYRQSVTIDGAVYVVHSATRTSGPIELGSESPASKRELFSINCLVVVCRGS